MKYVKSKRQSHQNDVTDVILMSFLSSLNIFHMFFRLPIFEFVHVNVSWIRIKIWVNVYESFKKLFFCNISLNVMEVFIICVTSFENKTNLNANIFSNKAVLLKRITQKMIYIIPNEHFYRKCPNLLRKLI